MSRTMHPGLVENSPELAEAIQSIMDRFDRSYKFSKIEDQATFVEGMQEIGQHLALNNSTATLKVEVSSGGIVQVTVTSGTK